MRILTLPSLIPSPSFLEAAAAINIAFEPGELDRLGRYLALLLEATTQFNLTAIKDPNEAWSRHILDSLTLVPIIASAEAKTVIDVGSGGGLPGIPLAIVMPTVHFTLLESTGKKADFLRRTAQALNLNNITVINDRAEVIGQDHHDGGHRERYDLVVARAVGRLPVLLELTVPLAKVGGHVLAMKGEQAQAEIIEAKAAMHLLHVGVADVRPQPHGVIVIIDKHRKTPRMYPRKPGEPKRVPLGMKSEIEPQRHRGTEKE